jgi:hypothetical protein
MKYSAFDIINTRDAFVVRAEYLIQTVEEFEDTKGVIRIQKSTNDRQHNGQKKKEVG